MGGQGGQASSQICSVQLGENLLEEDSVTMKPGGGRPCAYQRGQEILLVVLGLFTAVVFWFLPVGIAASSTAVQLAVFGI